MLMALKQSVETDAFQINNMWGRTVLPSLDPHTDPPRVASGWTVIFS